MRYGAHYHIRHQSDIQYYNSKLYDLQPLQHYAVLKMQTFASHYICSLCGLMVERLLAIQKVASSNLGQSLNILNCGLNLPP